jgi:hypothetical protein
MTPAETAIEIDGWLFGVQRSLMHQRTAFHFDLMVAGFYRTPNVFISPK